MRFDSRKDFRAGFLSGRQKALQWWVIGAVTCSLVGLAVLSLAPVEKGPIHAIMDVEVSGVVVNSETNHPIDGAYVVKIYNAPSRDPNIAVDQCMKTRGTYVDTNGFFQILPERLDGLIPGSLIVVAPDHYYGGGELRTNLVIKLQSRSLEENFSKDSHKRNMHEYQDQLLSKYALDCWKARRREDAAAAIPALEILRDIFIKYYKENGGAIGAQQGQEISRIIYLLNRLSENGTFSK